MAERETSSMIDADAADWAVRADTAEFGKIGEQALEAWLAGDVRRIGAYARARAMMLHAGRVKALGTGFEPDAYASDHGRHGSAEPVDDGKAATVGTRRRFLIGGSAAIVTGLVGFLGFSGQAAATIYSTKRGEIRLVPLADGSSMTLNTATIARVRFTSSERHVELVEGEALFDVVMDTDRPFVVAAGETRVMAASTSFTLSRLVGQQVRVTVRQGKVKLIQPRAATRMVAANMRAVVMASNATVSTNPIAPAEINRALAWQQGMLSFEDTPLSQAAAQFARYSDTAIRFDDPSIGSETITGLYAANNPQGFARSAALSLGLTSHNQPGAVMLSR